MIAESNQQFSTQEAITEILNATKDGGLPVDSRIALLTGVVRELAEKVEHLRLHLRDESQMNAANTETLRVLKQAVCKAAWALSLPGADEVLTGLAALEHEGFSHGHELLTDDAREAFAALAALDPSGYAPTGGSLAAHGILGSGQPGPTGYHHDGAGECEYCREPAGAHLCPPVALGVTS